MAIEQQNGVGSRVLRPLVSVGGRAAAATLRPFAGVAGAAASVGRSVERRVVDGVLNSAELERIIGTALNTPGVQAAVEQVMRSEGAKQVMRSEGAKQVIAGFFDSGLLDDFIDHLLESPSLWRLIDEVAASPAVTAAITQQSLGFADQVGAEVRVRSRDVDDWLERAARRLARRHRGAPPGESQNGAP